MKSAQQLQQESFQAYNNFRSVPANAALVTSFLVQIDTAAQAAAHLGLYSCSFALGNLNMQTSSSVLCQRFLSDELLDLGYSVTFSSSVTDNVSVSIDWTPQDDS